MGRLILALVLLAVASPAFAKPKVAVIPIKGDSSSNKLGEVVVEALEPNAKVTGPKETGRAMTKLDLTDELSAADVKKLAAKLDVTVVVQGTLEKDGSKRTLHLTVFVKGKKATKFAAEYKTMPSDKVKRGLRDELAKRLETGEDEEEEKPKRDPDEDKPKHVDEDKPKHVDEDKPRRPFDTSPKRRVEEDKPKHRVATEDPGEVSVRKRKHKKKHGDEPEHAPMANAMVAAGASAGVRRLTYKAPRPPPRVGTFAGAGRVEGEIYPFGFSDSKSELANLGFSADFEKTLGLSITVPAGTVPIDQAHYSAGVLYRLPVGSASQVVLGTSYVRRHYIADRSGLTNPTDFDAPDVDYTAIAPSLTVRTPITPTLGLYAHADGLLILDTGGIQKSTSYGPATVYGFDVNAGIEYPISPTFLLCIGAEVNQISFSFKGTGDMAMSRGVTSATDRTIILASTLAVTY
jgi:hypothetical protein